MYVKILFEVHILNKMYYFFFITVFFLLFHYNFVRSFMYKTLNAIRYIRIIYISKFNVHHTKYYFNIIR